MRQHYLSASAKLSFLALCAGPFASGPTPTHRLPLWPTASRIAFASNRDGNWEIYLMSADYGSRAIRLTNRPEQDRFPLWSPDGKQIAFGSQVGNDWELWVMN